MFIFFMCDNYSGHNFFSFFLMDNRSNCQRKQPEDINNPYNDH